MSMAKDATGEEVDVTRRTAARLGWPLFGLSALLLGVAFLLSLRRPQYSDLLATTGELLLGLVIVLSFGWFGALIVARQPRQPIGWILCALAGTIALTFFANEYAIYGLITDPGAVPGAAAVAWFATWAFAIPLGLLAALLLLFPTGRPPSPRWRWWLWVAGVGNLLFILSHLSYWPLRGAGLLRLDISDPAGLPGVLYTIGATAGPVAVVAAGVSVLVRFRRAQGAERQQIKWLLYAVLTAILGYPLLVVVMTALGYSSELAGDVSVSLLVAPIPLAMGLAILRFRLYDIDRPINRTLGLRAAHRHPGTGLRRGRAHLRAGVRRGDPGPAQLGSSRRHPGRGRAVPAGPPPHPSGRGSALQPPQVQRGQDHRGLQRPVARRDRPGHPLGRAAGGGPPDNAANHGGPVASTLGTWPAAWSRTHKLSRSNVA
jgi:hypothetical protein